MAWVSCAWAASTCGVDQRHLGVLGRLGLQRLSAAPSAVSSSSCASSDLGAGRERRAPRRRRRRRRPRRRGRPAPCLKPAPLLDLGRQQVDPRQRSASVVVSRVVSGAHDATPRARPTGTAASGSTNAICSGDRPVRPTCRLCIGRADLDRDPGRDLEPLGQAAEPRAAAGQDEARDRRRPARGEVVVERPADLVDERGADGLDHAGRLPGRPCRRRRRRGRAAASWPRPAPAGRPSARRRRR